MSDNDIRLAIAEAVGWIFHEGNALWIHGRPAPFEADADVLNDLNACREMRATLTEDEQDTYAHELSQIVPQRLNCGPIAPGEPDIMCHREYDLIDASARQHCEAFLKSKNLWKP